MDNKEIEICKNCGRPKRLHIYKKGIIENVEWFCDSKRIPDYDEYYNIIDSYRHYEPIKIKILKEINFQY